MDPDQTARLLRGLFAADPTADRAAVDRALAGAADWPAVGERLANIGLATRYQAGKLKHARIHELLFGPYLICEKIGEGGMGKVYRAVHADTGTLVALKVVRPHLMANAVVQKRYAREAQAAASFDHPNIIKLLAEATHEGRYYLAMEYIDGTDLSRLVREYGRPPERGLADPAEAVEYVRQTALGLQHAHDRGFVHRDVKPSNLLAYGDRALPGATALTGVKILDMGLVRRLMGDDDVHTSSDLTRDGTVVGTPDYMSPEQAKNSSTVDGRADLYSLGCTLYFLLHGRPPFDGGSPIDKLLKHHTEPVPDARVGRPDVPRGLADVVSQLMQKNPADRFQTAAEVASALLPYSPGFAVPEVAAVADPFSLAPKAATAVQPAAQVAAPAPARSLRLKVKPSGPPTGPSRGDRTPSSGGVRVAPSRTPAAGSEARRRTAVPPSTDRLPAAPDTPPAGRPRPTRRPPRRKKPVWPLIATGVAAVLILGVVALLLSRGPTTPTPPTVAPTPEGGKEPAAAVRPVVGLDAVADRASAVVLLKPSSVAGRLPTANNGRLARVLRELAAAGLDPAKLNRATVSLVDGDAVVVGEPAVVAATNPTDKTALEARRATGRPAAGLTADLQAAVRAAGEGSPAVGFAADGGFTMPGGDKLSAGRVSWLAARAVPDGDGFAVSVTLAGPDRSALLDFVSLELAGKLPTARPPLKPVCDRLAAADPVARRSESGLELTFRFRVEWPELLGIFEQLLPAE